MSLSLPPSPRNERQSTRHGLTVPSARRRSTSAYGDLESVHSTPSVENGCGYGSSTTSSASESDDETVMECPFATTLTTTDPSSSQYSGQESTSTREHRRPYNNNNNTGWWWDERPYRRYENIKTCLFVANLNLAISNGELIDAVANRFQQWGHVVQVNMNRNQLLHPYAFVQYRTAQEAKRALQYAPGILIHGRQIRVELAKSGRMYNKEYYRGMDFVTWPAIDD